VKIRLAFVERMRHHPALARIREFLKRHHYSMPFFLLRETLAAFRQHNGFNISASLSFYAMFALIPMALLLFFLLSHLATSSSYAIEHLTTLTGKLVPKFSRRIMIEVYNVSRHKAVWGVFGMFALFWAVIPLAGTMRAAFHTIFTAIENRSFFRRQIKDALAVLGILLLFFLFSLKGLVLENVPMPPYFSVASNSLASLLLSTLLIAIFFRIFFPIRVAFHHILLGSLLTACLWLATRPAFGLFLFVNQSYGTIFGGMKNMFISIGWLYYSFVVFLLGTELIAVLHKRDALLLKGLFTGAVADTGNYHEKLMHRFGKRFRQGEYVFHEGDQGQEMYFIISGMVTVYHQGRAMREFGAGEYFGEMAVLSGARRAADAIVQSREAEVLLVSADNFGMLLQQEPGVAISFLREMARRYRQASGLDVPRQ
jgi:membrane protein